MCGAFVLFAVVLANAPHGDTLVPLEQGHVGGRYAVDCTAHWLGFLLGEHAVRPVPTAGGAARLAVVSGAGTRAARLVRRLRAAADTATAAAAEVARAGRRRMPATLAGFAAATGFRRWPHELVAASRAKHLPRRIYRNPGARWSMSVAETLNADGTVRETEIVERRAAAGQAVDFFVYAGDGRLAAAADFGAPGQPALLPAPAICARCHYDPASGRPRREPTFLGAAR
ncbi:MAG: hypothetical protein RLW62_15815 [Gammaproteobacteria bacterium]